MEGAVSGTRLVEDSILAEQESLETEAAARGVARYRRLARQATERGDAAGLKPVERLLLNWFEPLSLAIAAEQVDCLKGEPGKDRAIFGPIIRCLHSDRIAVITMHETLGHCLGNMVGSRLVRLAYSIGSAVIAELHWDILRKESPESLRELSRKFKRLNTHRRNWWAKRHLDDHLWSRSACLKLGSKLIELLLGVATCRGYDDEEFQPAFEHKKIHHKGKWHGAIAMHPDAVRVIEDGHLARQALRPRYLPMIVSPYPWSDDVDGGYIRIRTPFISKPSPEQEEHMRKADLATTYESINALGRTPWTLNRQTLEYIQEAWRCGGREIGIPSRENYMMPPRPGDIATNKDVLAKWKKEAWRVHTRNHQESSTRAEFMSMLGTAEMMRDRKFYLPHMCDFRGRAYPIPIHLNHHGPDLVRGLLLFDQAKPLGDNGAWWIKVQAANMWGLDKAPFEDRVSWSESNWHLMRDSAADPLACRWWQSADEPLQFLAACIAMVDEEVAMRLPIQMDGTCNGLQHYAGMSRNPTDAETVNLSPCLSPNDPYELVTARTLQMVEQDVEDGSEIASSVLPFVTRKACKQTVMTTPYGVTRTGGREQVKMRLHKAGFARENLYKAADYLSRKVSEGIGSECRGGTEIMNWIQQQSRLILKAYPNESLRWTTPLSFPVVQPYRSLSKMRVSTCLQRIDVGWRNPDRPAHVRKQIAGVVPNFVHGLDGAHMHSTNLRCHDQGVEFAEVHDSYWTHACDVDELGAILREEFVSIHSENQLDRIDAQWREFYPDAEFIDKPGVGSFDINSVLNSLYFFS